MSKSEDGVGSTPDPREHLRQMIAEKLRSSDAVGMVLFPRETYLGLADAVLELFDDEVTVQGRSRRSGVWWANEPRPDATRFVLYTVPTSEATKES